MVGLQSGGSAAVVAVFRALFDVHGTADPRLGRGASSRIARGGAGCGLAARAPATGRILK